MASRATSLPSWLAVVSVDNFPSELLADFPAAGWLRALVPARGAVGVQWPFLGGEQPDLGYLGPRTPETPAYQGEAGRKY